MLISDIKSSVLAHGLLNIPNTMLAHQVTLLPPNNIQVLYSNLATKLLQPQNIVLSNFQLNSNYHQMFLGALATSNSLLTRPTIFASLAHGAMLAHPASLSNFPVNFSFLNNRFAWIGAIENFQQTIGNLALMTDIVADKFALDIAAVEILPLFKELDEKVVADIVINNKDITLSQQTLAIIKELLPYKAALVSIFLLMNQEHIQTKDILLVLLIFLLDYFDKRLNTK